MSHASYVSNLKAIDYTPSYNLREFSTLLITDRYLSVMNVVQYDENAHEISFREVRYLCIIIAKTSCLICIEIHVNVSTIGLSIATKWCF